MRRLWMIAAFALLAGCEDRQGEVVGAERPGAQQAPAAVGAFVVDSEPNATARLLATVQAMNQSEIAAAQLATEKASSEEVKSFARKLIDDHQRNMQEVSELARDKKLDVQGAINADSFLRAKQQASQEHLSMLRGLSGQAFDAAFMAGQPANHVLLAEIAEQAQSVSNDGEIDSFFASTHRDALEHRDHAQRALTTACSAMPSGQSGQGQDPNVIQPGGQGTQGMQMQGQGAQTGSMGGDPGSQGSQGTMGGFGTRGGEGALRGDQGAQRTSPMDGSQRGGGQGSQVGQQPGGTLGNPPDDSGRMGGQGQQRGNQGNEPR